MTISGLDHSGSSTSRAVKCAYCMCAIIVTLTVVLTVLTRGLRWFPDMDMYRVVILALFVAGYTAGVLYLAWKGWRTYGGARAVARARPPVASYRHVRPQEQQPPVPLTQQQKSAGVLFLLAVFWGD